MESRFLKEKVAGKISQVIEAEIPVEVYGVDDIRSSCGRIFYEGTEHNDDKMESAYKFKFRWYDENWNVPLDKIHVLENFLREAVPEVFSDGSNEFCVRHYKIRSSGFNQVNISGMSFYCGELNFSIIV